VRLLAMETTGADRPMGPRGGGEGCVETNTVDVSGECVAALGEIGESEHGLVEHADGVVAVVAAPDNTLPPSGSKRARAGNTTEVPGQLRSTPATAPIVPWSRIGQNTNEYVSSIHIRKMKRARYETGVGGELYLVSFVTTLAEYLLVLSTDIAGFQSARRAVIEMTTLVFEEPLDSIYHTGSVSGTGFAF
jgi:hypothetical protein